MCKMLEKRKSIETYQWKGDDALLDDFKIM